MAKQVQISEALFFDLYEYFMRANREPELVQRIYSGIREKSNAIIRRDSYSAMAKAQTEDEHERARQEYVLDLRITGKNPDAK